MLSYRHAFHAGNHADVLKHIVLVQLLRYLNQKDTPYMVIDTHAGAGMYALDSSEAVKNAEFESGISRLWSRRDLPAAVADYIGIVKSANVKGALRFYPGSPMFAEQVMRDQDRLRLFELHPRDAKILQDNVGRQETQRVAQGGHVSRGTRVMVSRADGFAGLKALLPPPSRRGLVLIDPPYEVKDDYRRVKETLADALKRFAGGIYAIWYPVLQRNESRQFAEQLKRLPVKSWLNVTLATRAAMPDGFGLHHSGMFILNPPWTLEPLLRDLMPYLCDALKAEDGAGFILERSEGG